MGFHQGAQDGLDLLTSCSTRLGLPKCWNYRHVSMQLALSIHFNSKDANMEFYLHLKYQQWYLNNGIMSLYFSLTLKKIKYYFKNSI